MIRLDQACPECRSGMLYDAANKRFSCKKCGLYLTKDQLSDLRYKARSSIDDNERRRKSRQQADYLEWWLSGKKEQQ